MGIGLESLMFVYVNYATTCTHTHRWECLNLLSNDNNTKLHILKRVQLVLYTVCSGREELWGVVCSVTKQLQIQAVPSSLIPFTTICIATQFTHNA